MFVLCEDLLKKIIVMSRHILICMQVLVLCTWNNTYMHLKSRYVRLMWWFGMCSKDGIVSPINRSPNLNNLFYFLRQSIFFFQKIKPIVLNYLFVELTWHEHYVTEVVWYQERKYRFREMCHLGLGKKISHKVILFVSWLLHCWLHLWQSILY